MKGTALLINEEDFDLCVIPDYMKEGEEKDRIKQGFVIGNSSRQNQALMLYMHPGELKEYPMSGIGIMDMTLDENMLEWQFNIRTQLEEDGYTVNSVSVDNNLNITIDAKYN